MKSILKKITTVLFVTAVLLAGIGVLSAFASAPTDLYDSVWKLINNKYVDQSSNSQDWESWRHKYDNKIKTDEDAYVAIGTMIASLNDPYTKFLNPKDFAEETSSIKGSLKGIGIQIATKEGKLMVIAPIEDSPAEKAGIIADDEIIEINGESTKGITIDKAADKIRGEQGTTVILTIKRKNCELKKYSVIREEIEIKSVSTKAPNDVVIPDNIGYIRLSSFISQNAAKEFGEILVKAKDKNAFIIDLRSNPGGLLTNALIISDMLLPGGIIVSTVDRDGYKKTEKSDKNCLTQKPLVVLINKGSASASEILSGALKDNGRATIIGEQSFGKGLVQEINKLPGGSGVNITIQKYLTPNGTDIHKKGITPDIIVEITDEDITKKNDAQLKKAISFLNTKLINAQTCKK